MELLLYLHFGNRGNRAEFWTGHRERAIAGFSCISGKYQNSLPVSTSGAYLGHFLSLIRSLGQVSWSFLLSNYLLKEG